MSTIYEHKPGERRESKRYRGYRGSFTSYFATRSRAIVMIWAWWWTAQNWYVRVEDTQAAS